MNDKTIGTLAKESARPTCPAATVSLAEWNASYKQALREAEDKAALYKKNGDMYGWNFWQGVASGLRSADIQLCIRTPNGPDVRHRPEK